MKCFIFVACLFVAVCGLSDDFQEKVLTKLAEVAEKCVPEVGASDEDIAELMDKKMPTKKSGKCLIACFSKSLGMMKNGKFNTEGAMSLLEPMKTEDAELYGKFKQVAEKCVAEMAKVTEPDECELSVKFAVCSQTASKEAGLEMDSLMG